MKNWKSPERNERGSCQVERENSRQPQGPQDHRAGWMVTWGSTAGLRSRIPTQAFTGTGEAQNSLGSCQLQGVAHGFYVGWRCKEIQGGGDGWEVTCGGRREDPDFEFIRSGRGEARCSQNNNCE